MNKLEEILRDIGGMVQIFVVVGVFGFTCSGIDRATNGALGRACAGGSHPEVPAPSSHPWPVGD